MALGSRSPENLQILVPNQAMHQHDAARANSHYSF
jgi:hypothetical protein